MALISAGSGFCGGANGSVPSTTILISLPARCSRAGTQRVRMESSCLTWIFAGELNLQPDFGTTQPWLTTDTSQVASSGIVSVTVDSSKLTDNTLKVIPDNGLCEPHTFCKPSGTTCGSALDPKDPLYSQSVAVC